MALIKDASQEERRRKAREKYANNREAMRAYQREYNVLNKDRVKQWGRTFRRTPYGIFKIARKNALARGLSWTLTMEEFHAIRANPCHYCGGPLPQVGAGLDRIDHRNGYEPSNVLPCCFDCNAHRQHTWTVEETKAAVAAVLALRRGNG